MVIFAVIWSIGATTNAAGCAAFDTFFKKLVAQEVQPNAERTDFDLGPGLTIAVPESKMLLPLPKESSVYEVMYNVGKGTWMKWLDTMPV